MSIYEHQVTTIAGEATTLENYRGKVLLIVNTASRCGFTPQYAGLQALYEKYKDQGFVTLGFPCNQFGEQEPGTNEEVSEFCQVNYGVTFPMFGKIDVRGESKHPLFRELVDNAPLEEKASAEAASNEIQWNFTKFLVDREGHVVGRFDSKADPESTIGPVVADLL